MCHMVHFASVTGPVIGSSTTLLICSVIWCCNTLVIGFVIGFCNKFVTGLVIGSSNTGTVSVGRSVEEGVESGNIGTHIGDRKAG